MGNRYVQPFSVSVGRLDDSNFNMETSEETRRKWVSLTGSTKHQVTIN